MTSAKAQAAGVVANLKAQGVAEAEASGLDDSAMVALIAYLQRMGTDIVKPADAPTETSAPAPTSAVAPVDTTPGKEASR